MSDRYVDENGDTWHRVPPFGCWERDKDRSAYNERVRLYKEAKHASLNASRAKRGLRPRTDKEFSRSADRYRRYLEMDNDMTFREFLEYEKHERRGW